MKNKVLFSLFIILVCSAANAADKSDGIKPRWIHSLPKPSNSTFIYTTETSIAPNLSEARKECFSSLLQNAGFEKGVSVQSNYNSHESEHSVVVNGKSNDVTESHFTATSTIKGKEVALQGIKIDEYWERRADGKVYLTTLFARSQVDAKPRFDDVTLTTKYGLRGFWRSAIVPGWGQLYKGSTLKGSLILGGTAVLIGATIYTDCVRADYSRKINKTHIAENKRTYATRRDNFTTGRNICIGALGALYVYNIIDAIVAPGARRIVTNSKSNKNYSYNIGPTLLEDCSPGLAMQITF